MVSINQIFPFIYAIIKEFFDKASDHEPEVTSGANNTAIVHVKPLIEVGKVIHSIVARKWDS
jgi:hypothetical protein